MNQVKGRCVCGGVKINIREYGNFVYACHCDNCRRMNSGPVLSVDPGPEANVDFESGRELIAIYIDEDVERGFCSVCGTTLFWHDQETDHYCMNAELFDDVIKNASFDLELFYDMKPDYYTFAGERKKLDRKFEELK